MSAYLHICCYCKCKNENGGRSALGKKMLHLLYFKDSMMLTLIRKKSPNTNDIISLKFGLQKIMHKLLPHIS